MWKVPTFNKVKFTSAAPREELQQARSKKNWQATNN
jgi:hypothetical protein